MLITEHESQFLNLTEHWSHFAKAKVKGGEILLLFIHACNDKRIDRPKKETSSESLTTLQNDYRVAAIVVVLLIELRPRTATVMY